MRRLLLPTAVVFLGGLAFARPADPDRLDRTRSISVSTWESWWQPLKITDPFEIAAIVSEIRHLERAPSPEGWRGTSRFELELEGGDVIRMHAIADDGGLLGVLDGFGGFVHYKLTHSLAERLAAWAQRAVRASKKLDLGAIPGGRVFYEEKLLVHRVRVELDERKGPVTAWILGKAGRCAHVVEHRWDRGRHYEVDFDEIDRSQIEAVVVSVDGAPRVFSIWPTGRPARP
jgi:hypothetical protein